MACACGVWRTRRAEGGERRVIQSAERAAWRVERLGRVRLGLGLGVRRESREQRAERRGRRAESESAVRSAGSGRARGPLESTERSGAASAVQRRRRAPQLRACGHNGFRFKELLPLADCASAEALRV